MYTIEQELYLNGIVPVLKINNANNAVKIACAVKNSGLNVVEITFRTADAAKSIQNIAKAYPDMLIGAGTVLSIEQVEEAMQSGAKFIVSPGFNEKVVNYCIGKNIPIIPGVNTPTEIEKAMEYGLKILKFFPAEASGGIRMLKSLASPYKGIKFMPTGGITPENMNSYLSLDNVLCCGGSWMVKDNFEESGDFNKIENNVSEVVKQMLNFSFDHVGIYTNDENEAKTGSNFLEKIFNMPQNELPTAIYSGKQIEFLKHKSVENTVGHLALSTDSPDRARYFLSKNNIEFVEPSARYNESGRLCFIYLKDKIANFSIHLTTK